MKCSFWVQELGDRSFQESDSVLIMFVHGESRRLIDRCVQASLEVVLFQGLDEHDLGLQASGI